MGDHLVLLSPRMAAPDRPPQRPSTLDLTQRGGAFHRRRKRGNIRIVDTVVRRRDTRRSLARGLWGLSLALLIAAFVFGS
jgi:hypothetical protein